MSLETPHEKRPKIHDTPLAVALDEVNEMSFPASDPISATNITRIETALEMAEAATDLRNQHKTDATTYVENLQGVKSLCWQMIVLKKRNYLCCNANAYE